MAKKAKRLSGTKAYVRLLSMAKVPSDGAILKEVKRLAPHTHPTPGILAWYKTKYRKGELAGLEGRQAINQG